MGFAYLSRWRFVGFEKYPIPHRLDVGIALPFPPIKRSPPFSCYSHFSPPLKAYLEYYPIVLGIYFLPQFLRKLICGLKFVIFVSGSCSVTPEDLGYCRTSLNFGVLYLVLFSALAVIIFVSVFCRVFPLSTIHMNSNFC